MAMAELKQFKLPDVGGHALPRRMNSDWDGNLWVGLWEVGKLMKVDYKTKQMTVYTPKTPSLGMYSAVADKKNHLIWVSAQQVDKIFRYDPAKDEFAEFPLSYAQQDPRRIDIELRTHGGCGHLPGVREPPTMRSQVPFGSATNSLGLLSLVLCPAQACAPPAQSFFPDFAMP